MYSHLGYFKVYATATSDEGVGQAVNNVNVSPYSRFNISSISGTAPALKLDGSTWDTEPGNTNPEIYFKVFNAAGTELTGNGGYFISANVLSSFTNYIPVLTNTDLDGYFTVQFLDQDLGSPEDDIIGIYNFRPANNFHNSLPFTNQFVITDVTTGATINVNGIWAN